MNSAVCFLGDSHGNAKWLTNVIENACSYGIKQFVQLGDFGIWPQQTEHGLALDKAFLDAVEKQLSYYEASLVFIDGNHEWHDLLADMSAQYPVSSGYSLVKFTPHISWLPRGRVWEYAGLRFLGAGGAPSIDKKYRKEGVNWWPGETLTDEDIARCLGAGEVDVVLAHDAPFEEDIPGLHDWWEGDEHRKLVSKVVSSARPRLLIGGHYHRFYDRMTTVGDHTFRTLRLAHEGTAGSAIVLDLEFV